MWVISERCSTMHSDQYKNTPLCNWGLGILSKTFPCNPHRGVVKPQAMQQRAAHSAPVRCCTPEASGFQNPKNLVVANNTCQSLPGAGKAQHSKCAPTCGEAQPLRSNK